MWLHMVTHYILIIYTGYNIWYNTTTTTKQYWQYLKINEHTYVLFAKYSLISRVPIEIWGGRASASQCQSHLPSTAPQGFSALSFPSSAGWPTEAVLGSMPTWNTRRRATRRRRSGEWNPTPTPVGRHRFSWRNMNHLQFKPFTSYNWWYMGLSFHKKGVITDG